MTQPTDWPRRVSWLAAILVALLALLSFILSYSSLRELALANGVGFWLSFIWPLLLDFGMIVCSVVILRASLRGDKARWPWVLTGTYTGLAVLGNILDVTGLGIPPVVVQAGVKALAALTCFVTFELLMGMVRSEVKRSSGPEGGQAKVTPVQLQVEPVAPVVQTDDPGGPVDEPQGGQMSTPAEQILSLFNQGCTNTQVVAQTGFSLSKVKRLKRELNGRVKV